MSSGFAPAALFQALQRSENEVLLRFENQFRAILTSDREGIEDGRKLAFRKINVNDRADDLGNLTFLHSDSVDRILW